MTEHDELLDNVAAYALGALPAAQAGAVEAHLQTCERCRQEYRYLHPAVTAVAYSAEACTDAATGAVAVNPLLKSRIMRRVRADAAPPRATPRVWPAYALAAACLALAIVTGVVDLSLSQRLNHELAQTATQTQTIADLAASDTHRYKFAGGEVVTRADRVYIVMRDMPVPPQGRVYQAWTLAKGETKVAPSMTFTTERGGVTVVPLPETAADVVAVAVSIEPAGGSKQPTTKPIAMVRI